MKNVTALGLASIMRSLREQFGLHPDMVVVSGDLAESGKKKEFEDVLQFVVGVCGILDLGRKQRCSSP